MVSSSWSTAAALLWPAFSVQNLSILIHYFRVWQGCTSSSRWQLVQPFQLVVEPLMVVVALVERMIFGRVASGCFRLSPLCVINPSDEDPFSPLGRISWFTLFCVSVTGIVLWGEVVKTYQYNPHRYSLQGHGSTQASPPRQGSNTEGGYCGSSLLLVL